MDLTTRACYSMTCHHNPLTGDFSWLLFINPSCCRPSPSPVCMILGVPWFWLSRVVPMAWKPRRQPAAPACSLGRSVHEVSVSPTGTLSEKAHHGLGRTLFAMGRNGQVEIPAFQWPVPIIPPAYHTCKFGADLLFFKIKTQICICIFYWAWVSSRIQSFAKKKKNTKTKPKKPLDSIL